MKHRKNELVHYLKPDWKSVDTPLSFFPISSFSVFCSHSAVAEWFLEQGCSEIYLIPSNLKQAIPSGVHPLREDAISQVISSLPGSARILNALEWASPTHPLDFERKEERDLWIRCQFHIMQALLKRARVESCTTLSSSSGTLGGFSRGLGLTVKKEAPHLNLHVVECNALIKGVFSDFQAPSNPIFRLDQKGLSQMSVAPTEHSGRRTLSIEREKSYLITGNGRIAKVLAKHLSSRYGCRIVIFGITDLTPSDQQELKGCGVSAYLKVNLGDLSQLKEAWSYFEGLGPVGGIFHLAGLLNDKILINKSLEEFALTIHPKVECTINLDHISARSDLDFFLSFSSLSGLVGNIGQSDYSAANGFLDVFSLYRNTLVKRGERKGLSASINWGLWGDGGMQIPFDQDVLLPLSGEEGMEALEKVLTEGLERTAIFKGDLSVCSPLVQPTERTSLPSQGSGEELHARVSRWVREHVVEFTKLSDLDDHTSLLTQGIDSVATINITSALESDLKAFNSSVRVVKTLVFDHPTIDALATYFLRTYPEELHHLFPTEAPVEVIPTEAIPISSRASGEDIAIVGMSGEFPKSRSVGEFWSHLINGDDLVEEIPAERWDWREFFDADPKAKGKSYGRHGAFLDSIKRFDARFFNIAPSEAEKIDPQERLFLQNVYHALEDGCLVADEMGDVGVFVSIMFGHYTLYNHSDYVIDSSYASIANRTSFFFNFKGPSIAIDTMCSGSLTALHLAEMSLKNGECRAAVVGGVNLMPHPAKYRLLSQGRFLSPSGKCHSFGKDADGYVPGEGVVVLVLKRLEKALEAGDRIYGVIKGSAINSSGRTAGYSVPAATAQSVVIQKALETAGVPAETISYIEAHGTGTSLGDPIEIEGLSTAFNSDKQQFCALGSLKSNTGHLESAAGLTSVVKVLMQFKHQTIAPTLHCTEENPLLGLQETPFFLAKKSLPWTPQGEMPRRAGVSSFGAGGSNAHVILEEPPQVPVTSGSSRTKHLLPLSAKSPESLKRRVKALQGWLQQNTGVSLGAVASALARGREHFRYRLALIADSTVSLLEQLDETLAKGGWEGYKTSVKGGKGAHRSDDIEGIRRVYTSGGTVNWHEIYPERVVLDLPTYPFEETEYWSEAFEQSIKPQKIKSEIHTLIPKWVAQEASAKGESLLLTFGELLKEKGTAEDVVAAIKNVAKKGDQPITLTFSLSDFTVQEELGLFFELCQTLQKERLKVDFLLLDEKQSALSGFFKSLTLENGKIRAKTIHIEGGKEELASILRKEASFGATGFEEVLYRDGKRFIKEYEPLPLATDEAKPKLKEGGVYLITGGMGKIGQLLTAYLLKRYGARVALLGSSPMDEKKEKSLAALAKQGGSVAYYQVETVA